MALSVIWSSQFAVCAFCQLQPVAQKHVITFTCKLCSATIGLGLL